MKLFSSLLTISLFLLLNLSIKGQEYFQIIPKTNEQFAIDIYGNAAVTNANISLWIKKTAKVENPKIQDNQLFNLNPVAGTKSTFIIRSKMDNNMVLDINASTNNIALYPYHGGKNQQFKIEKQNGNYYTFQSVLNPSKYIGFNGNAEYSTNIQLTSLNKNSILFNLISSGNSSHQISNSGRNEIAFLIDEESEYYKEELENSTQPDIIHNDFKDSDINTESINNPTINIEANIEPTDFYYLVEVHHIKCTGVDGDEAGSENEFFGEVTLLVNDSGKNDILPNSIWHRVEDTAVDVAKNGKIGINYSTKHLIKTISNSQFIEVGGKIIEADSDIWPTTNPDDQLGQKEERIYLGEIKEGKSNYSVTGFSNDGDSAIIEFSITKSSAESSWSN